jgi:hypothetical protein
MKFELNSTPPSAGDIAAERVAQTRTLAALRSREQRFLGGVTLAMGVSAATVHAVFGAGPSLLAEAIVAATIIPAVVASIVAHGQLIDTPRSDATRALSGLTILAAERCPEVLAWCQSDPVVAAYQTAVARQGRMLVKGELAAIKRWLDVAATRKAQAEELAACERLMRPVA